MTYKSVVFLFLFPHVVSHADGVGGHLKPEQGNLPVSGGFTPAEVQSNITKQRQNIFTWVRGLKVLVL